MTMRGMEDDGRKTRLQAIAPRDAARGGVKCEFRYGMRARNCAMSAGDAVTVSSASGAGDWAEALFEEVRAADRRQRR